MWGQRVAIMRDGSGSTLSSKIPEPGRACLVDNCGHGRRKSICHGEQGLAKRGFANKKPHHCRHSGEPTRFAEGIDKYQRGLRSDIVDSAKMTYPLSKTAKHCEE
jgi:hypothetical protein